MSTRGCMAVKTEYGWRGIYHHWDSYPSSLGKELWDFIKQSGVEAITDVIKQHPGGFSSFPSECYCHSEFAERDGSCAEDSPFYREDAPCGIKDSRDNPDPLFMEWVYVIDPNEHTMTILTSQGDIKTEGEPRSGGPVKRDDEYWDYGNCAFRHVEVAKVDLDGDEPDWEKMEGGEK